LVAALPRWEIRVILRGLGTGDNPTHWNGDLRFENAKCIARISHSQISIPPGPVHPTWNNPLLPGIAGGFECKGDGERWRGRFSGEDERRVGSSEKPVNAQRHSPLFSRFSPLNSPLALFSRPPCGRALHALRPPCGGGWPRLRATLHSCEVGITLDAGGKIRKCVATGSADVAVTWPADRPPYPIFWKAEAPAGSDRIPRRLPR
jgi:hypothetical protein